MVKVKNTENRVCWADPPGVGEGSGCLDWPGAGTLPAPGFAELQAGGCVRKGGGRCLGRCL